MIQGFNDFQLAVVYSFLFDLAKVFSYISLKNKEQIIFF